jgi:hypothetical protein
LNQVGEFATLEPVNLLGVLRWFVLGTMFLVACGGPISDFPSKATGGDDNHNPSAGGADAGSTRPPPTGDGDLASGDGDGESGGDGDSSPPLDAGAAPDGGVPGDAGAPSGDAGPDGGVDAGPDAGPLACTSTSDGRPDACYGYYCHTSSAELASGAMVGGACNDGPDLALVCDGAIPRVVASCTASNSVGPTIGQAIHDCAKSDASLSTATDACLQCYVDESVCMIQHCLGPCLAAQAAECEACRASECGDTLYTCTGLPKP